MVMGMACGLGQVTVALIGTAVVLSVLVLLFFGQRRARAAANKKATDLLDLFDGGQPDKRKSPQEK